MCALLRGAFVGGAQVAVFLTRQRIRDMFAATRALAAIVGAGISVVAILATGALAAAVDALVAGRAHVAVVAEVARLRDVHAPLPLVALVVGARIIVVAIQHIHAFAFAKITVVGGRARVLIRAV